MAETKKKHWVVCCKPKVVLSGWATDAEMKKKAPTLTNVRMCIYWSKAVGGPMGLAKVGPDSDCRISKAAPTWTIALDEQGGSRVEGYGQTSIEARKAWEVEPWG